MILAFTIHLHRAGWLPKTLLHKSTSRFAPEIQFMLLQIESANPSISTGPASIRN
jgi:hypothetical protein